MQRVKDAQLHIDGKIFSSIGQGYLILLGIEESDDSSDLAWLIRKIVAMRIFGDANGKMNLSIKEVEGECLVVSQFTLHASTRKGNRPSFIRAASPVKAIPLYEQFIYQLEKAMDRPAATGSFGANMQVSLTNDGPVTIILDSRNKE